MAQDAVTLETRKVNAGGKHYSYRVLRWVDPRTGKKLSETLGRADDRRHKKYITLKDAKQIRDAKAAEFQVRPGRRGGGVTLGRFLEQYAERRANDGTSPRTRKVDDFAGRLLTAYFGPSQRIDRIYVADDGTDRANARDFINAINDGELAAQVNNHDDKAKWKTPRWSVSSARKYLRNIRTIFNGAVREGLIDTNPFALVGVTTSTSDESWQYVDRATFFKLYKTASPEWRRVITLARFAALTREDILTVEWSRVAWEQRELKIKRAKTGADQVVPIDDTLAKIMAQWRGQAPFKIRDDRVVAEGSVCLGNPGRTFDRLCKAAGVARYGKPLHALRKSCITDWARTHPAHVVQVWAGHKSIQTTLKFYTRVSPADMDKGKGDAHARRAASSPKNPPKKPKKRLRASG